MSDNRPSKIHHLFNRSNSNSILSNYDLDLNPDSIHNDHYNHYHFNISAVLRSYLSAGLMAFTSAAMVMPFEVGKTLLQVQWIPSDHVLNQYPHLTIREDSEDYPLNEDEEDEEDLETYFTQTRPPPRPSLGSISKRSLSGSMATTTVPMQRTARKTKKDEWPEYMLPVVIERGVTDMIRAMTRWRGEGILSLWKGQLTTFVIDTLSSNLQPLLLSTLYFLSPSSTPSSISLPLEHHAYPGLPLTLSVGSYLLTGLLLSPLDLVRTRLIAQSSQLRHRLYSGPLDGLRQIVQNEGGYRSIFLHPNLLFPALLDNLLRPLLNLATPLIIDRFLSIDKSHEPVRFGLAEFGLSTLGLLIILPLETIRKRLQLQSRQTHHPRSSSGDQQHPVDRQFKGCVRLRPEPYNGIVEGIYRIITEEKSGLLGLLRGFNVGMTANFVVFILSLIGSNKSFDPHLPGGSHNSHSSGWAEV